MHILKSYSCSLQFSGITDLCRFSFCVAVVSILMASEFLVVGAFTTSGILTSWKFGCPFCCWLITCGEYFMHNALTLWALFIFVSFHRGKRLSLFYALHFILLSC